VPRSRALLRYLGLPIPDRQAPAVPEPPAELVRWMVRGEPRRREEFGFPHPGDFPGGLPLPPEYPHGQAARR
jgi:hypothetical protein